MRIAVTGANGLVGSRLCVLLGEGGHDVLAMSRGEKRISLDVQYKSVDVSRFEQAKDALDPFEPEVVINCASMTEVDLCEAKPSEAFAANVGAPGVLAQWCRASKAHLLHVSTDYVFDGDSGPYSVEDAPNPRGVYAVTKFLGEQAVERIAPSFAIARTAVVFGWPPAGRLNFGAWLVNALKSGAPVKLFEDQFVSPSFADNVAAMLAELGVKKLPGVWNTCGADVVDRVRFGKALCDEFGLDSSRIVPVKLADLKLASPRPLRSGLKVDKTRRHLSTRPMSLDESLKHFHRAYAAAQP